MGYWLRSWPIALIISYDVENGRIEATALSCHKGLVSGGVDFNIESPSSVRWGNADGENVCNLIICGAAYFGDYQDQALREEELGHLEFLDPS